MTKERTDRKNLDKKKYSKIGRTVGLMLRMCEMLYGTRKAVVINSGFCVSRGIVELERKGVYGAPLIKKKKYWPKGVPGAAIDAHFEDKDVNHCEILEASVDGLTLQVMYMKEPKYVMKIMCKWMTLDDFEGGQTRREYLLDGIKTTKTFCYKQPFRMHYKFINQVDDNNNRGHLPI